MLTIVVVVGSCNQRNQQQRQQLHTANQQAHEITKEPARSKRTEVTTLPIAIWFGGKKNFPGNHVYLICN